MLRLWQEVLRAEVRAEDIFGGRAHPAVENGGVDGAEIDSVFQVAVLVETAQAGRLAEDAPVDGTAQYEHRSGGAVIGAQAAIFFDAAPKLRPGHDNHVIGLTVREQVVVKGGEAVGKRGHQSIMRDLLTGMGIKTAQRDVAHAQAQVLHNGLGQNLESSSERSSGIGYGRAD